MLTLLSFSLHFLIYRRCKRCIRGHIKSVFESRVLAQELEKAANQQEKNKGKAKEDGQGRIEEVGDNGGIEALLRELIMGFPTWTKANESSSRKIDAELKKIRAKGADFQTHMLQEVELMQSRFQVLESELMKKAQAKGNGGL